MKKSRAIIALSLIIFHLEGNGQSRKFYKGLGVEIGAGYNTATWRFNDTFSNHIFDTTFHRNKLWIQPTARIYYEFKLFKIDSYESIRIRPFIGYYTFGGKSGPEPDGYKDIYVFHSLELGIIPTLYIENKLQFGVGFKGEYIFDVITRYFGTLGQADSIPREWQHENVSKRFQEKAINVGINLRYKYRHFTIGGESWLGLTNLNAMQSGFGILSVTENNFRILIGYEI